MDGIWDKRGQNQIVFRIGTNWLINQEARLAGGGGGQSSGYQTTVNDG